MRQRVVGYGVMTQRIMAFSASAVDRDQGSYGSPGGSDTRGARTMIEPLMRFSLESEADSLRLEPEYREGDRNSRTLAKETDLRVMLTVLREGAAADVLVYDLEELAIDPPWIGDVEHDLPGGEWRRVQRAKGYHQIIVNGELTFEDGECTGTTPGSLLRGGRG